MKKHRVTMQKWLVCLLSLLIFSGPVLHSLLHRMGPCSADVPHEVRVGQGHKDICSPVSQFRASHSARNEGHLSLVFHCPVCSGFFNPATTASAEERVPSDAGKTVPVPSFYLNRISLTHLNLPPSRGPPSA